MKGLRDWFKKDESEIGRNNPAKGPGGTYKKGFNPLWIFLGIVVLLAAVIIISKFC